MIFPIPSQNFKVIANSLEDDGYFYANFYVASPKILENQLISMSKQMKKNVKERT